MSAPAGAPRIVREWSHAGLDCLVIRMPDWPNIDRTKRATAGWHCGYVRLPDGCDLPERDSEVPEEVECAAHGGVTFRGTPHFERDGSWYGFDMNHCFDREPDPEYEFGRYIRTDADAIAATERLADAIAGHAGAAS